MTELVVPERLATEMAERQKRRSYEWLGSAIGFGLAVLTAALYSAGRANREGYLFTLGFDPDQLRGDFHEIVFWGFVTSTPIVCLYLIVGMAMVTAYATSWWGVRAAWAFAIDRWPRLRKLAPRNSLRQKPKKIEPYHKLFGVGFLFFLLLYVLLGSYLMIFAAKDAGTERGRMTLSDLKANAPKAARDHDLQWIEIHLASEPYSFKGYRLGCSEHFCTIFDPRNKLGRRMVATNNAVSIEIFDKNPADATR